MISFTVNGAPRELDIEPDTPLLWALRDVIGLRGTRFGCGAGLCGACTVHVDGVATRTCIVAIEEIEGANISTIEGLSEDVTHPVQLAWKEIDVPQCGYCQSGQIMAAAALLSENPTPTNEDIDEAMMNICRCATYLCIRHGIHRAVEIAAS